MLAGRPALPALTGVARGAWRLLRSRGIASFAHDCNDIGFAAHNLAGLGVAHMKDLLLFQRVNTKHGSLTW
jgi:hypothetical protein